MSQTLEVLLASNVGQIAERRTLKDKLTTPREVEHYATFTKKKQASAACAQLEKQGFTCTVTKIKIGEIDVVAAMVADVTPETTDRLTALVFTIVVDNKGTYEGWGGSVLSGD